MKVKFKPGQEVVATKDQDHWSTVNADEYFLNKYGTNPPMPKKNEIYTVDECHPVPFLDRVYITLKEFPDDLAFNQKDFAPVMPTKKLADELSNIFQTTII